MSNRNSEKKRLFDLYKHLIYLESHMYNVKYEKEMIRSLKEEIVGLEQKFYKNRMRRL